MNLYQFNTAKQVTLRFMQSISVVPNSHQLQMFDELEFNIDKNILSNTFICSRQIGSSFFVMCWLYGVAAANPLKTTVMISPTKSKSKDCITRFEQLLQSRDQSEQQLVGAYTFQQEVRFTNGHVIKFVSAEPHHIAIRTKGTTIDHLVTDGLSLVPQQNMANLANDLATLKGAYMPLDGTVVGVDSNTQNVFPYPAWMNLIRIPAAFGGNHKKTPYKYPAFELIKRAVEKTLSTP